MKNGASAGCRTPSGATVGVKGAADAAFAMMSKRSEPIQSGPPLT
jgi:hypothetical protein